MTHVVIVCKERIEHYYSECAPRASKLYSYSTQVVKSLSWCNKACAHSQRNGDGF